MDLDELEVGEGRDELEADEALAMPTESASAGAEEACFAFFFNGRRRWHAFEAVLFCAMAGGWLPNVKSGPLLLGV